MLSVFTVLYICCNVIYLSRKKNKNLQHLVQCGLTLLAYQNNQEKKEKTPKFFNYDKKKVNILDFGLIPLHPPPN